jgi:hypothetical protein
MQGYLAWVPEDCAKSWPDVSQELRVKLNTLVVKILDNFDRVSKKCLTSDEEEKDDPTMYRGSAGVIYAMYRYSLLLYEETGRQEPNWLNP